MSRTILLAGILLASSSLTHAAETDFAYPPTISLDEVRQWVDRAAAGPAAEHPRLFASRAEFLALRESLDADPARRALADAVVRQADFLCKAEPITRTLQGRRLLGESRRCVKRMLVLAMAYQLTDDVRYAKRGQQEMLAIAKFSDWNPSHFLDVAEMTLGMAVGYDWLHADLDESARQTIRDAIIAKGVSLPFETRHKGWVRATNNWGQVCHGGLTAGALAVMEDDRELAAKTVHNALHNVTRSMNAYAPNGSYPEGPGYWAYGTNYNVVLLDELESVLGSDFGLTKAPGFNLTGQYVSVACGPSGRFFNYADGGAGRSLQPALFWFASRFERPDWSLGERERVIAGVARVNASHAASGSDRLLPMALLWMDAPTEGDAEIRMPLSWSSEGKVPVTVHRASWTDPATTFVGFKAGSPSAPHGQMDVGSFVLDADGVRWALDLGAEGYHGIESRGMNLWSSSQKSDRWTIFRQMNHGHNTLVIDDQLQHAAGHAKVIHFSDDPDAPCSIIDMSDVYKGQAETVLRGIALLNGRDVLIQDELTGLKPGSRVRWGMITPGAQAEEDDPADTDPSRVELVQGDARLALSILAPSDAVWREIDTATPRNEWDSSNRGTRMMAIEAVAPESGQLTLSVLASPVDKPYGRIAKPEARLLEDWRR